MNDNRPKKKAGVENTAGSHSKKAAGREWDELPIQEEIRRAASLTNPESIIRELDNCPIGSGTLYEVLTERALVRAFSPIIDEEYVRRQVKIDGGKADIVLPFAIEMLGKHEEWRAWQSTFEIDCILVEVKNTKAKATHEDVGQLKTYVDSYSRGGFGLLVSRSGFTENAYHTIKEFFRQQTCLLPLNHRDLKTIVGLSKDGQIGVIQCLRRKVEFVRR